MKLGFTSESGQKDNLLQRALNPISPLSKASPIPLGLARKNQPTRIFIGKLTGLPSRNVSAQSSSARASRINSGHLVGYRGEEYHKHP